ncbi:MAG TPA: FAD-binding oxidoreductase [Solirubrobacteraceae bacterium]|jgi:glycine/D-amino acid oxidase-like deaminating enzyme|nr:FAD-binding oxidoreductase [Solirubrobacteraceae bacterium]
MRVCITGGGIAGTLLAWRLARRSDVEHVELLLGEAGATDATGLSGGVVRAYERHPEGRRLAVDSLDELLSSRVLRAWAGYCETGALYLRPDDPALAGELAEIDARVPGSARVATRDELSGDGWAGLPGATVAVVERRAGHVNPSRLRTALLADLTARPNVRVVRAAAGAVLVRADGTVTATTAGRSRPCDVAVLAAGAWTPGVLHASGLPSAGLRTKSIQCATYAVRGRRPLPFADETSGLYGRPLAGGRLLLGLATEEWDVAPGRRAPTQALHAAAARLARERMPWLRLGNAVTTVNATDCYCDPPVLALRPVAGEHGPIWTFTGGSGGSVKTALAASKEAAAQLLRTRLPQPSTHGE